MFEGVEYDNAQPELPLKRHLQNVGRAEEKLMRLLEDAIFDTLSKHNDYWDTDKLDDVRMKLSCIKEQLEDIQVLINPEIQ